MVESDKRAILDDDLASPKAFELLNFLLSLFNCPRRILVSEEKMRHQQLA